MNDVSAQIAICLLQINSHNIVQDITSVIFVAFKEGEVIFSKIFRQCAASMLFLWLFWFSLDTLQIIGDLVACRRVRL